jgi:ABC-type branched-subunit amino acid transport system permease subunit
MPGSCSSSTPSWPVTLGGTALTGGKFSLAGTVIGALIIQTLTSMIYSLGVPPEVNLVVKAAPGVRGDAAAVARVPRPGLRVARRQARMNRRLLPLSITILLFIGMAAFRRHPLRRLPVAAGVPESPHRQCIPVHRRGGHDIRDPLGRHRPVGRRRHRADDMISASLLNAGWNPYASMVAVLVLGAGIRALQGFLIQRFNLAPFSVTLAGMFLARGCCISSARNPFRSATPLTPRSRRRGFPWASAPR